MDKHCPTCTCKSKPTHCFECECILNDFSWVMISKNMVVPVCEGCLDDFLDKHNITEYDDNDKK